MAQAEAGHRVAGFTGFDVSKSSYSAWAGTLIAPTGDLDTSGLRLYLLGEGGAYRYGGDPDSIYGIYTGGEVLAGYGFEGDTYSINLLLGGNALNHTLSEIDLENPVEGTKFGVKGRADARINPTPTTLAYAEGEYSTAFDTYYALAKLGVQLGTMANVFIGPEAAVLGDSHSGQWRVGAHVTDFNVGPVQVTVSAGYADDRDVGASAYGHIEVSKTF